jgi:acetyl-CoA acetyltransferase
MSRRQAQIKGAVDSVILGGVEMVITSDGLLAPHIMPLNDAGYLVVVNTATMHRARKASTAGVDGVIHLIAGAGGKAGWLNGFAFVAPSATSSLIAYEQGLHHNIELTCRVTSAGLDQCGLAARQLDVIELHDAFSIEESQCVEAMGLYAPGEAIHRLKDGEFDIGSKVAVSPPGKLVAMGYPIGLTGVGQIGELTLQLRGDAASRQQPRSQDRPGSHSGAWRSRLRPRSATRLDRDRLLLTKQET